MGNKLLAAVCCLLLLTSCDSIVSDTESLLRPPILNKLQEQVIAALETTLNISDIDYKYPQRGEYRTPFVFYDMDGDGVQEAIVFYSYKDSPGNARAKILRQDAQGRWTPHHDISMSGCDQVDFVEFANLLSVDSACIIVGWQNTGSGTGRSSGSVLSIYSLSGDSFSPEVARQSYLDYMIRDFDGDDLAEIVTVERDPNQAMRISLLRSVGRHIDVTSTLPLCPQAENLVQMLDGPLWDGSRAVYLDERLISTDLATEIIRVDATGLTVLAGGEEPEDLGAMSTTWEHYADTWREDELLSRDYNGDGQIEVPFSTALPGNFYEGSENPLQLTGLMQLTAAGFQIPQRGVINLAENYLFIFPETWVGWVSVQQDTVAQEWRFYLIDPETSEPTVELLRIQTYTDGQSPQTTGRIDLGSRGSRHYYGYIPLTPPSTENVLSITEEELRELFIPLT